VRLPDTADDPVIGQLTFLDNAVQGATGTVNLRATIANSGHRFWPGRFVNVRLVLSTIHQAVLIPATAPQTSAKGSFVYVVKQDSTAEQRPISLGQRQGDLVVVETGVQPGERIVTNGQLGVTPGGKVLVEQPRDANSAATSGTGSK
jgi:multidrug efflux system membrane fusion protein